MILVSAMKERDKIKTALKVFNGSRDEGRKLTQETRLAPCELDEEAVAAVGVLAGSIGLGGEGFNEMAQTWLRPIVDEGYGTTRRGLNRARAAIKFLGAFMGDKSFDGALKEAGLNDAQITAFIRGCPGFKKVFVEARAAKREMRGMRIEDTGYEMATKGTVKKIRDKSGAVVDEEVVKSEKMVMAMLPLSGKEFQKGVAPDKGGSGAGGGVVMNFHFDGKGKPSCEVVDGKGAIDV